MEKAAVDIQLLSAKVVLLAR